MLSTMNKITCSVCGGEDAPIVLGEHIDPKYCAEHRAKTLLFRLLKLHEEMIANPGYFSKSNPTKQSYYGALNYSLELLTKAMLEKMIYGE